MPRIISTNGSNNIEAIKKYFCSEYVVKRIAEVTGMDYDIPVSYTHLIRNAPFASSDQVSARFKADSTIMLEVPVSFGGKLLPPMRIKVKTSAGYTPRF